jgi:hypothetical protein
MERRSSGNRRKIGLGVFEQNKKGMGAGAH